MATTQKILLVHPTLPTVRPLAKALRQQGYQVSYAPDGTKALELCVLRNPDLVILDESTPVIEAPALVQILEANPRTQDIPVLLTVQDASDQKHNYAKGGLLQWPLNIDEVLSRIQQVDRRAKKARELRGDAKEIEGSLKQLALPDLLQVLALNRRTGRLALNTATEKGELYLQEGSPIHARLGRLEGEKALFRLMAWRDGAFSFVDAAMPAHTSLQLSVDEALLEGARRFDERARLLEELPPLEALLTVSPKADLPLNPHPVTAEVLRLLERPRRLREILDLSAAGDLEALGAVHTLLSHGVVERQLHEAPSTERPLMPAAELHALRGLLQRGRPPSPMAVAKVLVAGQTPNAGRAVLRAFPEIWESSAEPPAARTGFGTLASLPVGEVVRVDFLVLPSAPAAQPLWRSFSRGVVGILMLDALEATVHQVRLISQELRCPVAWVTSSDDPLPEALRRLAIPILRTGPDLQASLRAVLTAALQPNLPGQLDAETSPRFGTGPLKRRAAGTTPAQ